MRLDTTVHSTQYALVTENTKNSENFHFFLKLITPPVLKWLFCTKEIIVCILCVHKTDTGRPLILAQMLFEFLVGTISHGA